MADRHAHGKGQPPSALEAALTWLASPPAADPLRDLAPLRSHLVDMTTVDIGPAQYFKIIELFQTRAGFTASTVKPLLLDATLPVPRRLRTVAHGLMDVHGALAGGYLRVLRNASPQMLADLGQTPARLCALGLANLAQKFEVAQFVSAPVAEELWRQAQTFHALLAAGPNAGSADASDAERHMKAMLALCAAQPEGLSPRETAFLAEYLRGCAAAVDISLGGETLGSHAYWLDDARGLPPTAVSRRPPGPGASLQFSCRNLSRVVAAHLSRLAEGERPEAVGLPAEASIDDYRSVLARAMERWENPPKRQSHRRRNGFRVQVCTHLGPLWQQLRNNDDQSQAEVELPASDWMILNESASGYAVMHVAGELAGLLAGSAIGLRTAADKPWSICVVRWARSENPEHIELGLELVAPCAEAVRIARRGPGGEQLPVPAFLLPPLPTLDRGEALLTARGYFEPGEFTLVNESAARLQVTECVASQLSLHTACIEIFEFERNPG